MQDVLQLSLKHDEVIELRENYLSKTMSKEEVLKEFDWILVQDDDLRKAIFDICHDVSDKHKMKDMMQFNIELNLK